MRKVAVVKLYAENKQNSQIQNSELKAILLKDKATLSTLKHELEEARAELADEQVTASECTVRLDASHTLRKEKGLDARRIQLERQAVEAETNSIVAQYEALVTKPESASNPIPTASTSNTSASGAESSEGEMFYTPEGSRFNWPTTTSGNIVFSGGAVVVSAQQVLQGQLSSTHTDQLAHMQQEREALDDEIHSLHVAYLSLQSTGDANEKMLQESKYTAEHLADQAHEMVAALEAQLVELQQERQTASEVLLNCSRELSQNQAVVAHRLSNIEADMLNLTTEEEDLSRRLEDGLAEERRLKADLERLWAEERDVDMTDNSNFAAGLAAEEMTGSGLRPAGERLENAEMRFGNDFLVAIQALGSSIDAQMPVPGETSSRVRDSIAKASENINRARIAELVEMQRRQELQKISIVSEVNMSQLPSRSNAGKGYAAAHVDSELIKERGERSIMYDSTVSSNITGPSLSYQHAYQEGDEIESEIALIARRIRDRLMMPAAN